MTIQDDHCHPTDPVNWDRWTLSKIISALNARPGNVGSPAIATTMLFHVLRNYGWPGELALLRHDVPDIKQSLEEQHTSLRWKGELLDINGNTPEEYARNNGLDASFGFVPLNANNPVAALVKNMPGLHDRLNSLVQKALLQEDSFPTPSRSTVKPRL